jgi:hypothetical protein
MKAGDAGSAGVAELAGSFAPDEELAAAIIRLTASHIFPSRAAAPAAAA